MSLLLTYIYRKLIDYLLLVFRSDRQDMKWRKKRFSIFSDNGIPGPKPNFWIGNIKDTLQFREQFEHEYTKKYGNIFGYFLGALPILCVTDPVLIKFIQVKEFKNFPGRSSLFPDAGLSTSLIKKGIVLNSGADWKRVRSILCSTFTSAKIKRMSHTYMDATDIFLEKVREKGRAKKQFDIFPIYQELILDIIIRTSFGINTGVQRGKQSLFLDSTKMALDTDVIDILTGMSACFPETEPIPTKLRAVIDIIKFILGFPSVRLIFKSCQDMIEKRKELNEKPKDLLQAMIDGKVDLKKLLSFKDADLIATTQETNDGERGQKTNEPETVTAKLTTDEIKASALSFILAGYETTSITTSYATHLLASHPEIQEKVRDEIKSVIGEKNQIEFDDLPNMKYLEQIISETLRLFPVGALITNRMLKEDFMYNGIKLPKGAIISIPHQVIHKNPDYWPDPEKFIPERFSPENKNTINSNNYQPFGDGPRNCIGMRLALVVMKYVLACLLSSYKIERANEKDLEYKFMIFGRHPKEILIRVTPL